MKKNNIVIISILAVVVIALAVAVFYFINKSKQKDMELREVVEMMTFEKEQVEREFGNLATEYDGYTTTVRNDSLIKLLDVQKQKINQLLEELRVTKATNARRIAELKAELATVRTVMVQYVHQIDSLNIENTKLKTEKEVVTRKYTEAAQTVEQLSREKNNLTEVVTRASKLEIVDFSFRKLNSRGKKTTFFAQFVNLEISFTIGKNITAATGQKTVYLRLTRPDGEVLAKNPDNLFPFEDKRIAYSAKKDFEYEGENLEEVIYWKVEEIVQKGDYRA
ncbi:MAG: hypothetical protein LBN23_03730, partial [Paludibacter sp.]|nr:hypothetical protein [Paludibacter sp.]